MDEEFYKKVLETEDFKEYNFESEIEKTFSKINILVGQNNSGKSRLIRKIFAHPLFKDTKSDVNINSINKVVKEAKNTLLKALQSSHIISVSDPIKLTEKIIEENLQTLEDPLDFSNNIFPDIKRIKEFLEMLVVTKHIGTHSFKIHPMKDVLLQGFQSMKDHLTFFSELDELYFSKENLVYIPILRGLRPLQGHTDVFYDRTTADYFNKSKKLGKGSFADLLKDEGFENRIIFTGLTFYEKVKELKNEVEEKRHQITGFEKFLGENVFGEKIEITAVERTGVVHIKIGKETERPIYDLGDGIQSLIILTFPLFIYENAVFFIEEPEFMIHPGLQRKYLELLQQNDGTQQYFLTTHSNHFLDLTLDYNQISILATKKLPDEKFEIKVLSSGDKGLLRELGVQNSSVFLSNCTIWVEGVTDRLYLKKYLELYFKKNKINFIEDIHYSFVEYGGNNITHWSFLDEDTDKKTINAERIAGKAFVIVDKDGDTKLERKEKLEKQLGDDLCILPCEEIENTLSSEVIKDIIKKYEKGIEDKQFSNFKYKDYKNQKLGKFIEEKAFKEYSPKRKGGYKEPSGTLKEKLSFCNKALDVLEDEDQLTEEVRKLLNKIKEFIERNNPK
ncbi:AAA family ATPase [Candidatus Woesearchaeota archaeon]|nr:AAA family ATPase [Candidatus Woesearchaeota archaeon]